MNCLHKFYWEDSTARWTVHVLSIVLGACYASIRSILFRAPERHIATEMVVLMMGFNLLSVVLYHLWIARRAPARVVARPFRARTFLAVGACACLTLLMSQKFSASSVEAAIVNQRLRNASASFAPDKTGTMSWSPLRYRFDNVASIAETGMKYRIHARPELIEDLKNKVQGSLESSTQADDRKSGAAAFIALVAYARYNAVSVALRMPVILLPHGETGNLMVSHVPLNNGAAWWEGSALGNTVFAMPDPVSKAVFPVSHSTVVFDRVNFNGFGLGRSFIEADKVSEVVLINSDVMGASQTLDSIVWMNVRFEHSVIAYNGGPLYLENVTFANCRFDFGTDDASQRILSQIQAVAGGPITLYSP